MNHHSLKTLPEFFEAILAGTKTFEARYDDRGFGVGDMLMLCEYDQQAGFTARVARAHVTYILRGEKYGVKIGYVIMGIKLINE